MSSIAPSVIPDVGAQDPYRIAFRLLPIGAARCRLQVDGDAVIGVEVVDSNPPFEPLRRILPRLHELLARVRAHGCPDTLRLREERATLRVEAHPVGVGSPDEILVLIEDDTDRVRLGDLARSSQLRFDQAFYGNPAAMVIARPTDLRIIDVNRRWCELLKCPREQAIGRTTAELAFLDPEAVTRRIAQHRQFTDGYEAELELRARDGSMLTVIAGAKPIEVAGETYTLTTLLDITARKRAEQAFSAAFRASPAGMVLVDATTDLIVAVNDKLLEMTGDARDALVGRSPAELNVISPPREVLLRELHRIGRLDGVELELGHRCGTRTWTLTSTEMITLHGKPHKLSVFTDITERKLLENRRALAEASLRELNDELERRVQARTHELEASNRELEAFSYSISHDLRAPLRTIVGFSQVLAEDFGPQLPTEMQSLLRRICDGGVRMQTLIEGLLKFASLGRTGLHRRRIELDPLVRSVCDELIAGRELGERLQLHVAPLGTCDADPSLLRTVWVNLIDNALKYAQRRDPIVVEVGRDERDGEVFYYVRDNGAGFDMAHARKLFGVFQRLHRDSEFEGTGIGLANVRRIVERHNGRITATSAPDQGSRFEFTLGAP